jgi:molybdate/tungstate transport system ATP-binding protein
VIRVTGLSIRQGDFALREVSFTVPSGGFGVLTGPTGCGKTTLLECLAGLRTPDAGSIFLGDRDVTTLPPAARNVGYVPQDAAVFTQMSVRDNLAFALSLRRIPPGEIGKRVMELAEVLGLRHLLSRRAAGLSGGEAQRVAFGRALAGRPAVLLLDEPFNALDDATTLQLVDQLKTLRDERHTTILHVTHSPGELGRLAEIHLRLQTGTVESTQNNT